MLCRSVLLRISAVASKWIRIQMWSECKVLASASLDNDGVPSKTPIKLETGFFPEIEASVETNCTSLKRAADDEVVERANIKNETKKQKTDNTVEVTNTKLPEVKKRLQIDVLYNPNIHQIKKYNLFSLPLSFSFLFSFSNSIFKYIFQNFIFFLMHQLEQFISNKDWSVSLIDRAMVTQVPMWSVKWPCCLSILAGDTSACKCNFKYF